MSTQFTRRSTRPLTAESYQRAAYKAEALASRIRWAADIALRSSASPQDRARLTRAIHDFAIHDFAMHARRLSARHRGMSVVEETAEDAQRVNSRSGPRR